MGGRYGIPRTVTCFLGEEEVVMGTILFLIMILLGRKAQPNDYQWLALLVSLDSIAIAQWLSWCCRRGSKASGEES